MNNFKFGTKEIIATLTGCFLMVCERYLELYLLSKGIISMQVLDWVRLRILIVALSAVFFGPISGCIAGMGGGLLISVIFEKDVSYEGLFVLGFYGFIMGLYFGKMHYDMKRVSARTIVDFNAVQILAGILCALFLVPLVEFMIRDVDLYSGVVTGAKRAAGDILTVGIICPIIMLIVSALSGSRGRSRKA